MLSINTDLDEIKFSMETVQLHLPLPSTLHKGSCHAVLCFKKLKGQFGQYDYFLHEHVLGRILFIVI